MNGSNADDGDVWLKLGFSRFNLKKYSEAVPAFSRAIDTGFFNRPVGYYRIAMCYANLRDSKSALSWLVPSLAVPVLLFFLLHRIPYFRHCL